MKQLWRRIVQVLNRKSFERDLDEKIRHHLAAKAELHGSPEIAQRLFGNTEIVKENSRAVWTFTFLEQLAKDVQYGLRAMNSNRLFTSMAVLSLALGIGANTAIYSFLDVVMIRALPVTNPEELAIANWRATGEPPVLHRHNGSSYDESGGAIVSPDFPWPAYENLRDRNTSFAALFAHKSAGRRTIVTEGQAESAEVEMVSGNFFSGLGIAAAEGRMISEEESGAGSSKVAVLSFNYWRDRFGGDRAAVGRTVRIDGHVFTIVGVAPGEFFGVKSSAEPAMFVPIANRPEFAKNYGDERQTMFTDPHFYWVEVMGRLKPGIRMQTAQVELATLFRQFAEASAVDPKERANLPALWLQEGGSGVDSLRRQFSKPLLVLMTMVALILVIACANIANLLLARASARRREMAVRLSLGAGRLRVLRQLLTESLLLALPGGLLGLAVAQAGIRFLRWLISDGREGFYLRAQLDWRVLAFTLVVALGTGILFGLAPALQAMRVDVVPALKETRAGGRRQSRFARLSIGRALTVLQIAISLFLAAGAAIFMRSLSNLHTVELGFNPDKLLVFNLDPARAGYKDQALKTIYSRLADRFRSLPGVRAATMTGGPLVAGWNSTTGLTLPGQLPSPSKQKPKASYMEVGPQFFETMQMPLLLGRPIDGRDTAAGAPAAVVNEVFVRKYFPGQDPLGKHFIMDFPSRPELTIVGVSKTARYNSLKRDVPPVVYLSAFQERGYPPDTVFFELRTAGDPTALAKTIRRIVHDEAPSVPVEGVTTQTRTIDSTISEERIFANLCSAFALLALAIAAVGLYGTMAYAVSRRTNEIGIRVALGAARTRIVGMVFSEIAVTSVMGLAAGLAGVCFAAPLVKSFLFGVQPADSASIAAAVAVLAAATALAGYIPARRAARIEPMSALRHE